MIKRNFVPGLFILLLSFFVIFSCSKDDKTPEENCFDKIKNQNEKDIDCGGVCRPCLESMTAKVNGNLWVADTARISSSYSNLGTKFSLTGNANGFYPQISLVYLGAFSLGSHDLDHSSSFTLDINSPLPAFVSSGTLTISEIDSQNKLISGSFNFTSSDASTTYSITEGTFMNVNYQLN